MHKGLAAGLVVAGAILPATAWGQNFDVERATRRYRDLLHGPARAKAVAYSRKVRSTIVGVLVYWVMLASGLSLGCAIAPKPLRSARRCR